MNARLAKEHLRCKVTLLIFALLTALPAGAGSEIETGQSRLRECVRQAASAAALAVCEMTFQASVKQRIEQLGKVIESRLNATQRGVFDRNKEAWRAYLAQELEMIELTSKQRRDGLGPHLRSGATSQLYEQREKQLRLYLHNLSP